MQEVINTVVIDDLEKDIFAVTKALATKGISTIPIHYTNPTKALKQCEAAAEIVPRIIITDIQMTSGGDEVSTTDLRNTTNCLRKIVEKTSGPYVVLAWSSRTDSFDSLVDAVYTAFDKLQIRRPVYFGKICKTACSDGEDFKIEEIFKKFKTELEDKKQIKALMHWEKSVLKAANETVNSLVEDTEDDLETVLTSLGNSVAGRNLKGFESAAINEVLSYVLKDKLGQQTISNNAQEIWKDALSDRVSSISDTSKHTLNSLLHTDMSPSSDIVCPGDVWVLEDSQKIFKLMARSNESKNQVERFKEEFIGFGKKKYNLEKRIKSAQKIGYKNRLKRQLKKEYTDPTKVLKENMCPILLEISPTCDFSNRKKPLKTLVAGVIIPAKYMNEHIIVKKADSIISCPIKFDGEDQYIILSAKYILSLSEKMIAHTDQKMKKILRIRESLLQSWIHKISSYNSRIGTVSFH